MENYILLLVSLLEVLELLTKEEAKKLAKELVDSGIPATYEGCLAKVKEICERLEIKPLNKKVDFTSIEGKILTTKDDILLQVLGSGKNN